MRKWVRKIIHLVSSTGIWTHVLLNMSLPTQPMDQGTRSLAYTSFYI